MRLKELRLERELTQWDVANGIKTGQRNIGRWENGEVLPTADFIIKLSIFFGVSADYLLGITDDFGIRVAAPVDNVLSAQERELVEQFRELSPYLKGVALDTVRAMAGKPGGGSLQNKA